MSKKKSIRMPQARLAMASALLLALSLLLPFVIQGGQRLSGFDLLARSPQILRMLPLAIAAGFALLFAILALIRPGRKVLGALCAACAAVLISGFMPCSAPKFRLTPPAF